MLHNKQMKGFRKKMGLNAAVRQPTTHQSVFPCVCCMWSRLVTGVSALCYTPDDRIEMVAPIHSLSFSVILLD